jgi:hypothetical protein
MIKKYLLFVLLVGLQNCRNEIDFMSELKDEFQEYEIRVEEKQFFTLNKVKKISISKSGKLLNAFYEIPKQDTDSALFQSYFNLLYRSACEIILRDTLISVDSFVYQNNFYLLDNCAGCSDFVDDDCYMFNSRFLQYLSRKKAENIDSLRYKYNRH